MGIDDENPGEWVGAATRLVQPIDADDCAKYPSFQELVTEETQVGRGCTVRGGVGHAKRSVAEIAASCEIVVLPPVITLYHEGIVCWFEGMNFGLPVEECDLQYWTGADWLSCREQVLTWVDTKIEVLMNLCIWPVHTFRVKNGVTGLYSDGYDITPNCGL